ncbi:MAG: biopolymer transporter ExbD [Verrucomicrobiota bacterium]
MGKRKKRRSLEETGFQLAPMIDMTFLLLIFFMVTTKITKQKKNINIDLPIAATAIAPEDLSNREILNLDAKGQIYVGDRPVTMKELKIHLKKRLIAQPPLRIYVRADAGTKSVEIKKIMRAAAEAGALDIIFGSYKK